MKKGHSKTEGNLMINNFHFCMVTSRVEDFCVENKTVPTCKKLLPETRKSKHSLGRAVFKKISAQNWIQVAKMPEVREMF